MRGSVTPYYDLGKTVLDTLGKPFAIAVPDGMWVYTPEFRQAPVSTPPTKEN